MLESKIFDYSDYENRLAFNQELMILVASEFIKEATGLLKQLHGFAEDQDWTNLAIVAHRLKGASSEVSSYGVNHGATEIEQLAKQHQVEGLSECLIHLSHEFELLKAALIAEILS
ncbi:Hpt domain-containing protein [Marinomonas transparens]|uniref:Hpt domain-containing protein n=1 Tax=Marinomonas transparens TaxID=2795388 RepID=A0A934JPZ5_9GAMM|nr:Hpt domain-containing protein [Marinomonas transparens]MBJ7537959.1 Hpt domain-containing protein [Marinomonas transparens]